MRNRFGIPSSLAARAERFGLRRRELTPAPAEVSPTRRHVAKDAAPSEHCVVSTAFTHAPAAPEMDPGRFAAKPPHGRITRGRIPISSKRGLQVGVRVHPIAPARDPGSEQP